MTSNARRPAGPATAAKKSKPAAKPRAAAKPPKGKPGKTKRLRPGDLDGLVLACLSERKSEWPMTATAVAKVIGRSSGAVANCLHRLSEAKPKQARLATKKPRAYDLKGVKSAKAA